MTWNYRLFKDKTGQVGIVEVYYHSDGRLASRTNWMTLLGDDAQDVQDDLDLMQKAFSKPVLTDSDFKFNN